MRQINQQGFTYLEVMIAIVILTIGITAQLSALSLSMVRARGTEQRNTARQIASSTVESIFAARDIGNANGISNWEAINTKDVNPTEGIFEDDWRSIRVDPGADGIHGTADDACAGTGTCIVGGYTNNSPVMNAIQRKIEITDVPEAGITLIRKRQLVVRVRYYIGQLQTEETLTTMVADLPFYK